MNPTVVAAIVAGVVALVSGVLTVWATVSVARYRGEVDRELQTRLKIAEARLPAYLALWKCMAPVSLAAPAPLTMQVRRDFQAALGKAFYKGGFEPRMTKREASLILSLRYV